MVKKQSMTAFALILSIGAGAGAGAAVAQEQTISFDGKWREQGLLRLFTIDYETKGRSLDVVSDGTVSVLWRPVDGGLADARKARWQWSVTEGVTPTDLTKRGGDDRNLALYFVFVDPQTAANMGQVSATKLLRDPATRGLVYVWGGAHAPGQLLNSPYSDGLKTKILRIDANGSFEEQVDLDKDFKAAFGDSARVLVGLAVTADSDDTDGFIRASISDLRVQ